MDDGEYLFTLSRSDRLIALREFHQKRVARHTTLSDKVNHHIDALGNSVSVWIPITRPFNSDQSAAMLYRGLLLSDLYHLSKICIDGLQEDFESHSEPMGEELELVKQAAATFESALDHAKEQPADVDAQESIDCFYLLTYCMLKWVGIRDHALYQLGVLPGIDPGDYRNSRDGHLVSILKSVQSKLN